MEGPRRRDGDPTTDTMPPPPPTPASNANTTITTGRGRMLVVYSGPNDAKLHRSELYEVEPWITSPSHGGDLLRTEYFGTYF